jgi:protoheme IX farnesyltransferase
MEAIQMEPASVTLRDYITLAKPGIIMSNLITAFGGFWLASSGNIDLWLMIYALLGITLVMASGCVLNNYLDRELDQKMERTSSRPTATGKISPSHVLVYGTILGVVGTLVLALLVNVLSALLGIIGLFVYVWVYTVWLKRTSTWSTSIGGISGAMPPVIGYCAVSNVIDPGAWILFLILFLWQPPHFWALAIRRKEEYRAAGFPLLPVVRGVFPTKVHMIRYTIMLLPISLLLYLYGYVGHYYVWAATILGMIWIVMCVRGFTTKDDDIWAKKTFLYSINYLTILMVVMVLDTV